jgi:beta-glucanase (GH16 family)
LKILNSKNIAFLISIVVIAGCAQNNAITKNNDKNDTIPVPDGWELVWNDEFDGDTIDFDKWEHEVNARGGGNNELQYYTDRSQNSRVKYGLLTIQALKETFTGPEGTREYTSARLRTKNRGDWKYGRFEIKAKLPYGQGLWPAIWMLPTDWVYGGWAASGEIDIMELVGHDPATVYGTLHYGGAYPDNVYTGASYKLGFGNFALDFHVFALEWDATEIRWYVDDSLYQVQREWYSHGNDYPAPFNQRFHLLLNVAVGGNWPGNPDNTTSFPQKLEVDYIRVYQKTD